MNAVCLRIVYGGLLFAYLAHLGGVNAQASDRCGNATNNEMDCCGKDAKLPLHCLHSTFEQRRNIDGCKCLLSSNNKNVKFCQWKRDIITNKGECEFDPAPCTTKSPSTSGEEMKCSPSGKYPPTNLASQQLYCDYVDTMRDVRDAKERAGVTSADELFYKMIFTCWLKECATRLRIPDGINPSFTDDDDNKFHWCYPKDFDGNVPLTANAEKSGSRGTTYCELYIFSTSPCVRPPLCDKSGVIDRSKFMVPFINDKVNTTYCERVCPDDLSSTSEGDPTRLTSVHNGEECLLVPVCTVTANGQVEPSNFNVHLIARCVPMCDGDGNSTLPEGVTGQNSSFVVSGTCSKLPTCEADGKPPPFGPLNRFNANNCTAPVAPVVAEVDKSERDKHMYIGAGVIVVVFILVGGTARYICFRRSAAQKKAAEAAVESGKANVAMAPENNAKKAADETKKDRSKVSGSAENDAKQPSVEADVKVPAPEASISGSKK